MGKPLINLDFLVLHEDWPRQIQICYGFILRYNHEVMILTCLSNVH